MAAIPIAVLVNSIAELLTEAYAGPSDPSSTWFIDNEPDSGILGLLDRVSAVEASQPVDKMGNPGSTIAANAEHLRWSLALSNAALRGEPFKGNWGDTPGPLPTITPGPSPTFVPTATVPTPFPSPAPTRTATPYPPPGAY